MSPEWLCNRCLKVLLLGRICCVFMVLALSRHASREWPGDPRSAPDDRTKARSSSYHPLGTPLVAKWPQTCPESSRIDPRDAQNSSKSVSKRRLTRSPLVISYFSSMILDIGIAAGVRTQVNIMCPHVGCFGRVIFQPRAAKLQASSAGRGQNLRFIHKIMLLYPALLERAQPAGHPLAVWALWL